MAELFRKDTTKVDRSGAYATCWVAKSLVHAGFCRRCLVQLFLRHWYTLYPLSVYVNSVWNYSRRKNIAIPQRS